MSLDDIADPQTVCDSSSVAKLQVFFEPIASCGDIVRTRMNITPVPDRPLQHINVMRCDAFWVRENLRDALRHCDLVDSQIGVRGDDRTPREVYTLARQVTSETTLLALQPLAEAADGFLAHLRRNTGKLGVDVHCDGKL